MARMPITYNGTNTDNLFVMGWKNGKEVKLKVKSLSCHGGITVDPIVHNENEYVTSIQLFENIDNLTEGTVYTVEDKGAKVRYLFFESTLVPLDNAAGITGLTYGASYKTYDALYNDRVNLVDNTLYSVTDKGTVEQYLYKDNKLTQISGSVNENADSVPDIIENGIIEYNMPELINGEYRYKDHTELTTVICDMPNLKYGYQMFMNTSLIGFCGDLSALEDGRDMFKGCQLDEASIINIIDSLPIYKSGEHILTITHDSLISKEIIDELIDEANKKGWTIEASVYTV